MRIQLSDKWSVEAVHGRTSSGRSKPPKVQLQNTSGQRLEAYLKLPKYDKGEPKHSLEREWIATRLAHQLSLPCAQLIPVEVNTELLQMSQSCGLSNEIEAGPDLLVASASFGPGWSEWSASQTVTANQLDQASSIYFFDTVIQNWDRCRPNPNLLVSGQRYGMIDHEESFVQAAGSDEERDYHPLPWSWGGVENHIGDYEEHPLWRGLQRHKISHFDGIVENWKALPLHDIERYPDDPVFKTWNRHTADKIVHYILSAIENIDTIKLQIEANREK